MDSQSNAVIDWPFTLSQLMNRKASLSSDIYVYGPDGLPIEQINNSTGAVLYLHHDQQGSTRLLTGPTGKVEGKCTYSPYGVPTCEGTGTTPLGFDSRRMVPRLVVRQELLHKSSNTQRKSRATKARLRPHKRIGLSRSRNGRTVLRHKSPS
jgi:hypothetical protein